MSVPESEKYCSLPSLNSFLIKIVISFMFKLKLKPVL